MSKSLRNLSEVRVTKGDLQEKLEDNLKQHIQAFKEARDGWEDAIHTKLAELEIAIDNGDPLNEIKRLNLELRAEFNDEPCSHEEDYQHVLTLVEASADDEFLLTSREFTRYWEDDWDWKERFAATNSKYSG